MVKKKLSYDDRMRRKVAEIKQRQQSEKMSAQNAIGVNVEARIDDHATMGWRILRAMSWCLWAVVAWILAAFIIAFVTVLIVRYAGVDLLDSIGGQIAVQAILSVLILAFVVKPIYWVGKNRKLSKAKRRADQMKVTGFNRLPNSSDLMPFVYGVLAYYGIGLVVMTVMGFFVPESYLTQPQNLGISGNVVWLDLISIFVLYCVITPVCEELIFRGFLQYKVEHNLGFWPAAIIVSVLFAVAHGQLNAAITTFVLSMVACYQRRKTGSIWSGIGLHAVVNTVATILVFVVPML